ncbi:hypothetical protein LJC11_03255 [Bacteroidales bacterium OttesenSCG-928-I21]|nr:hypothetical protein [Bacteroidales bacterium OttesenSCG-928-I21]
MNEENSKLEVFSAKLTKETKLMLTDLRDSGGFKTWNALLENLYEAYMSPRNADKENLKRIAELESENQRLVGILEENRAKTESISEVNTSLEVDYNELLSQFNELKDTVNLPEDSYVLKIDKLNYRALQYVAEREGKRRKQNWTIDDILNYIIDARLIRGLLNAAIDSVPDIYVKKMIQEIKEQ